MYFSIIKEFWLNIYLMTGVQTGSGHKLQKKIKNQDPKDKKNKKPKSRPKRDVAIWLLELDY
jgi:hypothetical protein